MAGFERNDANPSLCRIFAPEIDRIWLEFESGKDSRLFARYPNPALLDTAVPAN